jgi:carboxyl-terminal processing protease
MMKPPRNLPLKLALSLGLFSILSVFIPPHTGSAQKGDEGENTTSERLSPTPKMAGETKWVSQALQRYHYLNQSISDVDFKEFIRFYMERWDGYHMYFLKSDLENFEVRFALSMHTYLQDGSLLPAYKIFEQYRKRAKQRLDWVFDRLDKPFDLTTFRTYEPDRSELDWPLDQANADAVWEDRLTYEVLNEVLSEEAARAKRKEEEAKEGKDKETKEEGKKEEKEEVALKPGEPDPEILKESVNVIRRRFERWEKTLGEYESWNVQETFLTALTNMFDPHSTFMSIDSLEDFNVQINNSFVGIGAVLQDEDGFCVIKRLLPGGPAEGSEQLKPDDKIVSVAQGDDDFVDVIDMKLRKIVKLIKGPKNTKVRLEIVPVGADPSDRKVVSLIRDEIKLTANLARAEIIEVPQDDKTILVGRLDLPSFYGGGAGSNSTSGDIQELIGKLKDAGVQGMILDLRHNGGGLLSEAVKLSGLFIPTGPVVQVKDTTGRVKKHVDRDPSTAWDGPLLVLVSRYSASASEIVAGALQDHHRAIIVGEKSTHGKGTVQAIFQVDQPFMFDFGNPKRSAAKITIQKFYLPSGRSTQNKGVPSDIVFPSANEFLPIGESDLPKALAWDEIPEIPLEEDPKSEPDKNAKPNKDLMAALDNYAKEHLDKLDEFKYLKETIAWYKERREQKTYSLNLETRRAKAKRDKDHQDDLDKRLKSLAKNKYPAKEILLDITIAQGEEPKDLNKYDEDDPNFDIHLRESLRLMAKWVDLRTGEKTSSVVNNKQDGKKEI